jgi:hypothetical protein
MNTNKHDPLQETSSESLNHAARMHKTAGCHNAVQRESDLKKILRARTRLMVCFCTLPVYVVAVWILLNNERGIDAFMYFYMTMWAGFAVDMASRRCPNCDHQFFVKSILMNLITRRCVNCGLSKETEADRQES